MIALPAWLTWAAVKKWPWGQILKWIAIVAAVIAVLLYIRNAELNRAKVVEYKAANEALAQANIDLQKSYNAQLSVLQASIAANEKRKAHYDGNKKEIQAQPDTGCARNSGPIRSSLRLLGNAESR